VSGAGGRFATDGIARRSSTSPARLEHGDTDFEGTVEDTVPSWTV
jgi:hypothetical protein